MTADNANRTSKLIEALRRVLLSLAADVRSVVDLGFPTPKTLSHAAAESAIERFEGCFSLSLIAFKLHRF